MAERRTSASTAPVYPIPIYLDEQIVFDLLAIAQDGLTSVHSLRNLDEHAAGVDSHLEGTLNTGALSLFGVSLAGKAKGQRSEKQLTEVSETRVHTSTSLLALLQDHLNDLHLIRVIEGTRDLESLDSRAFVQFRARILRNPLIEALEALKQQMAFTESITGATPTTRKQPSQSAPNPMRQVQKMFDVMLDALDQSGSVDLIAHLLPAGAVSCVIAANPIKFVRGSMRTIDDGEFTVLGKAIKVLTQEGTGVSLLRGTKLAYISDEQTVAIREAFASLGTVSKNLPRMEPLVPSPVLQVIPIAIYA